MTPRPNPTAEPGNGQVVRRTPSRLLALVKASVTAFIDHRDPSTAASLAYYAAFSLAPSLVIVVSISGMVMGRESVEGQIIEQFESLLGQAGAELLQNMIRASYLSGHGGLAAAIGLAGTLIGATALFGELSAAFERIFGISQRYRYAWLRLVFDRLKGLGVVVGVGFLLLASLVISTLIVALTQRFFKFSELAAWVLGMSQTVLSLAFLTGLIGLMFRLLSPAKLATRTVLLGAFVTATLFEMGKWALGAYLGKGAVGSVFGAAGALAIMLVWLNYVSMILLFGAEVTAQLHQRTVSPRPSDDPPSLPPTLRLVHPQERR